MTPAELKAARTLLGWSTLRLALRSGTTEHIVRTFEKTGQVAFLLGCGRTEQGEPLGAIRATLEAAGIEFTAGRADANAELVRVLPPAELGMAEIKRSAAVLLYLLTWQKEFGNDKAVQSLQEAKLDVAVVVPALGRPRVHEAVLKAFRALAGQSVIWDADGEVWRERRKGDPT